MLVNASENKNRRKPQEQLENSPEAATSIPHFAEYTQSSHAAVSQRLAGLLQMLPFAQIVGLFCTLRQLPLLLIMNAANDEA